MISPLPLLTLLFAPQMEPDPLVSTFLARGESAYVMAPAAYVEKAGTAVQWARDSSCFVYECDGTNLTPRATTGRVASEGQFRNLRTQLVRFDIASGRNAVLINIKAPSFFGTRTLVGSGGDVVFEVRSPLRTNEYLAQLWYAPTGKAATPLAEAIAIRDSSLISSPRRSAGLYAFTGTDGLRAFALTDGGFRELRLGGDWAGGTFYGNSISEAAVLEVTNPTGIPNRKMLLLSYLNLGVTEANDDTLVYEPAVGPPTPFEIKAVPVPAVGRPKNDIPLFNLDFIERNRPFFRVPFARYIRAETTVSPDGMNVCYETLEGFFVRSLIRLDAARSQELLAKRRG